MTTPLADSNSPPADGEVARYRAVSPLAVAALLLGILSPLAIVGPLLWLVPVFCVLVALVAMWNISSSGGELAGWNLALLGLLLSLLFGLAAPLHIFTRQYWLETRAAEFANEFIALLQQDRAQDAFQLTLLPSLRKPPDVDVSSGYANDPKLQHRYDYFLEHEPTKTLLAKRAQAKVERLASRWLAQDDDGDQIAVRYRISSQENGALVPLEVELTLARRVNPRTGSEEWQIQSLNVVQ